ncbi:MAG: hypothetical protein KJ737_10765 [Proteobacteria bacterium]|nr:hypothetical protein [Pseudomonadota bacterium]
MDYKKIANTILLQYSLPIYGRHGVSHWARVMAGGLKLAEKTGADQTIVRLFALFHDSRRENEKMDHGHGARGAEFLESLRDDLIQISDRQFNLLHYACVYHTDGMTDADISVQTCWDADRLDLGRIGVRPDPKFLCTDAAKDEKMIDWSVARSKIRFSPSLIQTEWGIPPQNN